MDHTRPPATIMPSNPWGNGTMIRHHPPMTLCVESTWFDFMDICREQWCKDASIVATFTPITDKTSPFTFAIHFDGSENATSG